MDFSNIQVRDEMITQFTETKFKRVILKYATTHNHPQQPTTIHNHPQSSTTTRNHPQPPTTIHNHPQPPKKPSTTTQKTNNNYPQPYTTTQKLPQKAKTCHIQLFYCTLDVNTDFYSDMKQWYIYMCVCVCLCVYIL